MQERRPAQAGESVLAGRYRLDELVSEQHGSSLWRAYDVSLARTVTVRTFAPGLDQATAAVHAARAASRLTDDRLARTFDADDREPQPYIVTEWPAGARLDAVLATGPIGTVRAAEIIAAAAEAITAAHAAGLAHLRLTPDSVWQSQWGDVKVSGVGTSAALAGEQDDNPALADTRGLARLLYAALTGYWPGTEQTTLPTAPQEDGRYVHPAQLRPGISADVDAVTCRALFGEDSGYGPPILSPAGLAVALAAIAHPTPDTQPLDALADQTRPFEAITATTRQWDIIPFDADPATAPPSAAQPFVAQPFVAQPSSPVLFDPVAFDPAPFDSAPLDVMPLDVRPADAQPAGSDALPSDAHIWDTPAEAAPADTHSWDTPAEAAAAGALPRGTPGDAAPPDIHLWDIPAAASSDASPWDTSVDAAHAEAHPWDAPPASGLYPWDTPPGAAEPSAHPWDAPPPDAPLSTALSWHGQPDEAPRDNSLRDDVALSADDALPADVALSADAEAGVKSRSARAAAARPLAPGSAAGLVPPANQPAGDGDSGGQAAAATAVTRAAAAAPARARAAALAVLGESARLSRRTAHGISDGKARAASRLPALSDSAAKLLRTAAVIIILTASVIVGWVAGHGASSPAQRGTGAAGAVARAGQGKLQTLKPVSASAFDPYGGADGANLAHLAIDSSPATAWHTQWYTSARFGNLKPGTGLLINLGRRVTISSVRITLGAQAGADLQVRVGDSAASLGKLRTVAHTAGAGGQIQLPFSHPRRSQYLLIWFTKLPQDTSGTFEASVYNVRLEGIR